MPTFITKSPTYFGLTGSTEKRADTTPDGTQWVLLSQLGSGKFFSSADAGATWTYSPLSDLALTSKVPSYPSLYIDGDGYAHVAWPVVDSNPQMLRYARGVPRTGGGWKWTYFSLTPGGGKIAWHIDVTAMRSGSGWVAWIGYDYFTGPGGEGSPHVARVNVSSTGVLTLGTANHGPPIIPGDGTNPRLGLEWAHTGDGKTPSAAPHLFVVSGSRVGAGSLRGRRAAYSGGVWTWETPVTLDTAVAFDAQSLVGVWDGSRLCFAYSPDTSTVRFVEWDGTQTAPVRRDPSAIPVGVEGLGKIRSVSITHDPISHDIFLTAVDSLDGDIRATRLTRATNTWAPWTVLEVRGASYATFGRLQQVRYAPRDQVDLIWGGHGVPGVVDDALKVFHTTVAVLTRTPPAPALLAPANGARLDLGTGAAFAWQYKGTGPGDLQSAWSLRRGAAASYTYWNAASKAFQAVQVWNAGTDESATFPPGVWANGATYPWTVATRNATGQTSPWASERSVVATSAPVVTVTSPVGLVFADSTPTVTFDYLASDPQRSYEVRVVVDSPAVDPLNPGPSVWTSGLISSTSGRSITVDTSLVDEKTYRAYVRGVSNTGIASAWASAQFTLSLAPPSGPLVQVVEEWAYGSEVPRARLRVQARSSFFTADQAVGTNGWEADNNATVAVIQPDQVPNVNAGYSITATVAGAAAARTAQGTPPPAPYGEAQPTGPLDFPVMDGDAYTLVAEVMTPTAIRAARVIIRWYDRDDGTGALLDTTVSDQVNTTTTGYTQVRVSASAPQGARLARVVVEVLGMSAGELAYVSRVSFHPGLSTAWQPGGFSETQVVRVERSDDGGATWNTVQGAEHVGVDTWQRATIRDRTAPYGTLVRYRAYTDVVTDTGTLTSANSIIAKVVLDSDLWTLRDVTDVNGEVLAFVTNHSRNDEDSASVNNAAGREYPVVDSEGPIGAKGTLTIYVPDERREATIELLRRGMPLLAQSPRGMTMSVYFLARDYATEVGGARTIVADYVQVG